jgi:hypothetical protein
LPLSAIKHEQPPENREHTLSKIAADRMSNSLRGIR